MQRLDLDMTANLNIFCTNIEHKQEYNMCCAAAFDQDKCYLLSKKYYVSHVLNIHVNFVTNWRRD